MNFKDFIKNTPLFPLAVYCRTKYFSINTKSKISKLLQSNMPIKLEIGAGNKKGKNGWTTLDINNGCDLCWDLSKGFPFPENTLDAIYSSHLLEHLTYPQINNLLKNSYNALRGGGIFSICVPNARLYIEAYLSNNKDNLKLEYTPAVCGNSKIDVLNYTAYMDGHHHYMFDEENLLAVLKNNGFKNIRLRLFDPNIDILERDFESIYAEGFKE